MFRLVNGRRPASAFHCMPRRTDIWFTPVVAVMFVTFLALAPLAFERRSGETLYVLSIFLGSLFLALTFTSAFFYLIDRSAGWPDSDACLGDILKSLRRAMSHRAYSLPEAAISCELMNEGPASLRAPDSGYLQKVDYARLCEAAARNGAVIRFLCYPGDFVLRGSPIASVCPAEHDVLSDQAVEILQHRFARAVSVERKRSIKYDPEYAIVRIIDIAALSMSPSFSDPVTTLACINALAVCLLEILRAPVKRRVHCDLIGQPRIFEKETPPERVLSSAFDPLRPIVKNSIALSVYLLQAISALAPFLNTPAQFLELRAQAEMIHDGACLDASLRDRSAIDDAYLAARRSLSCSTRIVETIAARPWQHTGLSQTIS
jgi:uncharacterized membrane protein